MVTRHPRAFVSSLPDLIEPEEYSSHPDGRLLRFEIRVTDEGVEISGDGFRPVALEQVLRAVSGTTIEQMLCG